MIAYAFLIARPCLAAVFLYSGVDKLWNRRSSIKEVRSDGLPWPAALPLPPSLPNSSADASWLPVSSRLGALVLAGVTVTATVIGHRFWLRHGAEFRHELTTSLEHVAIVGGCSCSPSSISQPAGDGPEMSDQAPGPAAAHAVAAHPPLSVAITTIGVMAIAMVGSSISSQLVDLDIADIAGGTGIVGP